MNFLSSILEGSKDTVQYSLELNCVSDFDITIHTNDSVDLLTLNTSSPKIYSSQAKGKKKANMSIEDDATTLVIPYKQISYNEFILNCIFCCGR